MEKVKRFKKWIIAVVMAFLIFLSGILIQPILFPREPVGAEGVLTSSQTFTDVAYHSNVQSSSTTYATAQAATTGTNTSANAALTLGQHKQSTTYYIYRYLSTFNTSSLGLIDGLCVTSIVWSMNVTLLDADTVFNVTLQVRNATAPAAFPHQPLWAADYDYHNWTGNLGVLASSAISTLNIFYNITLNTNSTLSTSGYTYVLVRSSRDISASAPSGSGDEFIQIRNAALTVSYTYSEEVYVDAYSGTETDWIEDGASPYLNNVTTSYIVSYTLSNESWFSFPDILSSPQQIWLEAEGESGETGSYCQMI